MKDMDIGDLTESGMKNYDIARNRKDMNDLILLEENQQYVDHGS